MKEMEGDMKFKDFVEDFEQEYKDWWDYIQKERLSFCSIKRGSAVEEKLTITQMLQFWKQYELERSIRFWAFAMVVSTIIISVANLLIFVFT